MKRISHAATLVRRLREIVTTENRRDERSVSFCAPTVRAGVVSGERNPNASKRPRFYWTYLDPRGEEAAPFATCCRV
jgi:hypothetical protein